MDLLKPLEHDCDSVFPFSAPSHLQSGLAQKLALALRQIGASVLTVPEA